MPEINLTNFEDGKDTETVADTIYGNFYAQNSDSLAVINGELDRDNISTLTQLTYKQIQDDAFSNGGQVGGTANLDYFNGSRYPWVIAEYDTDATAWKSFTMGPQSPGYGWFRGLQKPRTSPERWLAMPGASVTVNMPYPGYLLVFWSVTFTNDSQDDKYETDIAFIIGDPGNATLTNSAHMRRVRRTQYGSLEWTGVATAAYNPQDDRVQDRYKSRVYSGHYFSAPLPAGRHNLGMYIAATEGNGIQLKQSRVRARSLKYIYFRQGATF